MDWHSVARRQSGLIGYEQLIAAGLTRGHIDTLRRHKHLVSAGYRGLYRVGGAPETDASASWKIVLGSRSVLSYTTAAQWWKLPVEPDGRIHVTRPDRRRFDRHRLIRIHRTLLVPSAVTRLHGLPITTRTETLLDCIGWLAMPMARVLADRSFQQSWLQPADLKWRIENQCGRWGNRQLRELLHEHRPGAEAESERRIQKLLDHAGITGWTGNYNISVGGRNFRADVAFPQQRLIVEVEGWRHHQGRERRQNDMIRQNLLTQVGWRVVSFTWEDIVDRPEYVISTIRTLLAVAA